MDGARNGVAVPATSKPTAADATNVTIGGPCARCLHAQDLHGVVCNSEDYSDLTPMCIECIAKADPKADAGTGAFHVYELTPIVVAA